MSRRLPSRFPQIFTIRNKHETAPSRHTKFTEIRLLSTGRNIQSSAHVTRNAWLQAVCLLAVFCLGAGCQTMTEYIVPHPRHAEKSVHEAVTEVFDGLARTERDLKRLLGGEALEDKGRLFLQVGGSGIGSELAVYLRQGMSHILADAGYEIVSFKELEKEIRRHASGEIHSCDRRVSHAAARALKMFDGVGALHICVTSVLGLGLGELNNEGEYEERLRMGVTTQLLEAKWGNELFRDHATLTSRTVLKQAERHYTEKVRGMTVRERSIYRLLLDHVRTRLPRLPEKRR